MLSEKELLPRRADEIDRLFEVKHLLPVGNMFEFSDGFLLQQLNHRFADADYGGNLFVCHRIIRTDAKTQTDHNGLFMA